MPEEDEISLVVEGDNPPSSELGLLGKQRGKQPAYSNSHFAIEVVQDKFGDVLGCNRMMFYIFLVFNAGYLKNCQHAFKMPDQQFPAMCESEDHNMSEVQIFGVLINLIQFHIAARVEGNIVEDHHDLPQEVVNLHGRFQLGGDQNFDGAIVLEDFIELVEHGFIVFLSKLLSSFLLVLDGDGLLSF